jgi:hypothetical protein
MTPVDEAEAMDAWLNTLRAGVEPAPAEARRRVAARLAGAAAVLTLANGAAAATTAGRRGFLHSVWFGVAIGLPVGVGLGVAGHAAWVAPAAAVMVAPQPALPVVPAISTQPAPVMAVEEMPANAESVRDVSKPRPVGRAPEPLDLERELLLLEQARTRLAEGDPGATLALLRKHRDAYPTSALGQERDALTVRALAAAGRHGEARAGAKVFSQRYPSSVLRPSVERAVRMIP